MKEINNALDNLLLKIQESRNALNISATAKLEELRVICNESPELAAIYELDDYSFSMVDCSVNACAFLGIKKEEIHNLGFKYLLKIIHPENINAVYRFIRFYKDAENYTKTFSHTFYLKSINGWEWTYASVKPAIFKEDGSVKYLLAVGCSINDFLSTKSQFKSLKNNLNSYEEHLHKYLSMTAREKEILKLISQEYTSVEIGEKLSISPYTVDTHRKNLIEKLNVKSSIGLAKYALLFYLV